MELTKRGAGNGKFGKLVNVVKWIFISLAILAAASAAVNFAGNHHTTAGNQIQSTPPSSLNVNKVSKIDQLPDTHYYMDNAQLAEYNQANNQFVTRATNQYASRVGGPSVQQIEAIKALKADMAADFMSPYQVATRLNQIMPELNVVDVYNSLDATVIQMFESPAAMVYPIVQ